MVELSVVIPVRDEDANIVPLLDEIDQALSPATVFEVVVVDDGSRDGTWAALQSARAARPWLRLLQHRESCGQSAALRSGIRAARAPLIATLDGDGQNDPADLPLLLAAQAGGAALVCGQRTRRRDSATKRLSSRIANGIRRRVLRDGTPDTGCGLKLFPRSLFLDLPYFDHMHRFLPALARREGAEIRLVPVNHRPRMAGRSKYGTLDRLLVGITDLLGVLWLIRRRRRPTAIVEG